MTDACPAKFSDSTTQRGKMQRGSLLIAVSEGPTAQRFGLCVLRYLVLSASYNGIQVSHWLYITAHCSSHVVEYTVSSVAVLVSHNELFAQLGDRQFFFVLSWI